MNWKMSIDLKDIWKDSGEVDLYDDAVFRTFFDRIVERLKSYDTEVRNKLGSNGLTQYQDAVGWIETANDVDTFNDYLNDLHTWADIAHVWISTFI